MGVQMRFRQLGHWLLRGAVIGTLFSALFLLGLLIDFSANEVTQAQLIPLDAAKPLQLQALFPPLPILPARGLAFYGPFWQRTSSSPF